MHDYETHRFEGVYTIPIVEKTEFGRVARMGCSDPKKRERARARRRAKQKAR